MTPELAPNVEHDHDDGAPAYTRGLHPLDAQAFRSREFVPIEHVLAPLLPTQGLAMIHAPRGTGKTHVAMGIACAVASGATFLERWKAPKPRRVLFIDGEMPAVMLQERFARTADSIGVAISPEYFHIVAADLEQDGLPDLADAQSQKFFETVLPLADLIIIDNLSTICRSMRENEADTWGPVQSWLLRLRRMGKSVVLIHHSAKHGGQRGTSRKEDVLNTVIGLKRPPGYTADQGARFEVHYEKARGFHGSDAEPFEAWLKPDGWQVGQVQQTGDDNETLAVLKQSGLSLREIEERTGIPKSTIGRRLKDLDA